MFHFQNELNIFLINLHAVANWIDLLTQFGHKATLGLIDLTQFYCTNFLVLFH